MKRLLLFFVLTSISFSLFAQPGENNIRVTIKPFKDRVVYLGYYFGKGQYVLDSVKLDSDGKGAFTTKEKLWGGIYFVVFPGKRNFSEFVIDKNHDFSIEISDTLDAMASAKFTNSPENDRYRSYQKFVGEQGTKINALDRELSMAKTKADTTEIQSSVVKERKKIIEWRDEFKKKNPDDILTAFFKALDEPTVPPAEQHPNHKYDSSFAYYYYKSHYWDGVAFNDERLIRTPFYEAKLDRYFDEVLLQVPDTIYKECEKMTEAAKSNSETFKFLLDKFIRKYVNPKYMGQDIIFVKLYEKYFRDDQKYDWVNEKYTKFLFDRYWSIVANTIGKPAYDFTMTDTLGAVKRLYDYSDKHIVVCFWDPTCGHCQQEVPKLDSLFQHKWKKMGVNLIGVMVDGGKEPWMKYIREHHLDGWTHLYQTEEQRTAEKTSSSASYRQLFDIFQTPMLYLLDKDKHIVAKRLNYEQLNELIDRKEKNSKE